MRRRSRYAPSPFLTLPPFIYTSIPQYPQTNPTNTPPQEVESQYCIANGFKHDAEVIYGDTDSVFVNSNVTDLAEALKISAEFKKAVNDRYKLLEIDLDGIFKRLLLLQKKKYAAVKIEEGTRTSVEVKGLDMKRREFCGLSKTVSEYVFRCPPCDKRSTYP